MTSNKLKHYSRRAVRKAFIGTKRIVVRNKRAHAVALKIKRSIIAAAGTNDVRELYNLSTFYPTIKEYYAQLHDDSVKDGPLISILLPTYNTPEIYLRECIESILMQSYQNWELCIADDKSTDKSVVEVIHSYQKYDARIKLTERKVNGHISQATNSALEIAQGDYVGLMDHDDVLWPNALYEMVKEVKRHPDADLIYSDEDKIDTTGKIHSYPFLKPDFSPEFLESCNYITHFSCIRTSMMKEINGFRKGYEGAQDWDLFIRITEKTSHVYHIPKILYSWRIHEASTASNTDAKPYVYEAQKKLLVDHVMRGGKTGSVEPGIIKQHRTIKYGIDPDDFLSVVIGYTDLESSLRLTRSLLVHPAGARFEIIYFSSSPVPEVAQSSLRNRTSGIKMQFVSESSLYACAIDHADGGTVLFIDDSAEIMSNDWAWLFIADSRLDNIGVVCPVLLKGNDPGIVASAGIGIGYGPTGFCDMLADMPFDDPHYTRGLYAKSRRNVSAVNEAAYAIRKSTLATVFSGDKTIDNALELCLTLLAAGHRHIYTPYVRLKLYKTEMHQSRLQTPLYVAEDVYLNPNFNHLNQRMEVRA